MFLCKKPARESCWWQSFCFASLKSNKLIKIMQMLQILIGACLAPRRTRIRSDIAIPEGWRFNLPEKFMHEKRVWLAFDSFFPFSADVSFTSSCCYGSRKLGLPFSSLIAIGRKERQNSFSSVMSHKTSQFLPRALFKHEGKASALSETLYDVETSRLPSFHCLAVTRRPRIVVKSLKSHRQEASQKDEKRRGRQMILSSNLIKI